MKNTPARLAACAALASAFASLAPAAGFQASLKSVVAQTNSVSIAMATDDRLYYLTADDGGNGFAAGDNVELLTWQNLSRQKWALERQSGQQFRIKSLATPLYVAAAKGADNAWGSYDNVQLASSAAGNDQRWNISSLTTRGHLHYRLADATSYYLQGTDGGNGWQSGDNVQIRTFLDNWNFRWVHTNLRLLESPSIAKAPDGNLVAFYRQGEADGTTRAYVARSTNGGTSWNTSWSSGSNLYGQTLFTHSSTLYMIGCVDDKLRIRKSTDSGVTWTDYFLANFDTTGADSGGGAPVLNSGGYLYYGFMDKGGPGDFPSCNRIRVASCPTGSDPTVAANWTITSPVAFPSSPDPDLPRHRNGWSEPNLISLGGHIMAIARVDSGDGSVAAALKLNSTRTALTFANTYPTANPTSTGFIASPFGASSKFHILRDSARNRYLIVSNRHNGPLANLNITQKYDMPANECFYDRNQLALYSTTDFVSFTLVTTLIDDDFGLSAQDSVNYHGFQQPSFIIDGNTLRYLSRTAYGQYDSYHEANMITYHEYGL